MQQVGVDNFHTASLFLLEDFSCKIINCSLNTNILQLGVNLSKICLNLFEVATQPQVQKYQPVSRPHQKRVSESMNFYRTGIFHSKEFIHHALPSTYWSVDKSLARSRIEE